MAKIHVSFASNWSDEAFVHMLGDILFKALKLKKIYVHFEL